MEEEQRKKNLRKAFENKKKKQLSECDLKYAKALAKTFKNHDLEEFEKILGSTAIFAGIRMSGGRQGDENPDPVTTFKNTAFDEAGIWSPEEGFKKQEPD